MVLLPGDEAKLKDNLRPPNEGLRSLSSVLLCRGLPPAIGSPKLVGGRGLAGDLGDDEVG